MPSLDHTNYGRLLDFIAELQEPTPGSAFGARLVSLVSELVPGSLVSVDQIHEPTGRYLFDHNCPLDQLTLQRYFGRLLEVYQQNPIYPYIQGGGKGPVVRLSDISTRSALHRTDFYQDIFRPLEIEHQMTVLLPRAGWITTLTINRDDDFPQELVDLLNLASRHIILAHRTSQLIDEIPDSTGPILPDLTRRENEVFRWMAEGKRNGEIALILGCSVRTVEKHVEHILRKTSAETRGAAVRNLRL